MSTRTEPQPLTLARIADLVGATLAGDPAAEIAGVAALEDAGPGQATLAEHARYADRVREGAATAFVVPADFPACEGRNLLRVAEPRVAFVRVCELFVVAPALGVIHPDASVDPTAELGEGCSIGARAVVEAGARLGARTVVDACAYVGRDVVVGDDCRIGPNASLLPRVRLGARVTVHAGATVGGDGFGFLWLGDHHHRVPQIGTVQVDDDVEIGCNSCVDRATLGVTRVRRGTKIDNLVQVAHNADVGEHVILVGQSGMGGSVKVGSGTVFAGMVGVVDHITIGRRARIGAGALVIRDIPDGDSVWGVPAREVAQAKRENAALARLPELRKLVRSQADRIADLEARLARLEARDGGRSG